MKDDKPKKYTPKEPDEIEIELPKSMFATEPVAAPEPAPDAVSPEGTHFDNLKKARRAGKSS